MWLNSKHHERSPRLYKLFDELHIPYEYLGHPPAPTIEKQQHQGKLSFASESRLMKYLGVTPGSVTPFGFINDTEHHVHVFLDRQLQQAERVSFHPCINTASLMIARADLERFLQYMGIRTSGLICTSYILVL